MNRYISLLVAFAFVLVLSSCEKEDPEVKGRLKVKIMYNNEVVVNAVAGLATSQQNLNKGIYVKNANSDITGVANFGAIEPGTYYCDAFKYINNNQNCLQASMIIIVKSGVSQEGSLNLVQTK